MGKRRTIALACVAFTLLCGLWALLSRTERRDDGRDQQGLAQGIGREEARPDEEDDDVVAPPASAPAPESARERAAQVAEAAKHARASDAQAAASETLLLQLVLAETGAAAALADVWYLDAAAGEELDVNEVEGAGPSPGMAGGFRRAGRKERADERGKARLPVVPGHGLQVFAELDGRAGMATFAYEPGPERRARLELVRDGELRVQVLQSSGEPAAKIPVFLRAQSGGSGWSTSADTRSDGVARFAHAGLRAREHPGASWSTGVSLPISTVLEREVEPSRDFEDPIVLRLPPLGEVEVLVLEADGKPVADGTGVRLGVVGPGQPRDLSPFAQDVRRYAEETTHDGTALFRAVESGFEVEIRAGANQWQSLAQGFFPGPLRAGERIQRTLRVEIDHPVLVFRAVDERGDALRETVLELGRWSRSGWNTSRDDRGVQTDAEGAFRVDLAAGWKDGDQHRIRVTARVGAIGAVLDLSRSFETGLNPMGDLVLRAAPLLAEGRVVDARRAGVAGAEVVPEDSLDGESWETIDVSAKSGAEGAFSLRGFAFGERLRLSPRQEGKSGAPVECGLGERGVELVLVGTGAVAGAVLLDEGVPPDRVHLRLVPEGASEDDGERERGGRTEPGSTGEFRIDGQLPGRYALEVFLEDDLQLLELPGVVVTAGETSRDPRLAAIDLRRRLVLTRLRFLPPEPDASLEGNLAYSSPGGVQRWHYFRGNTAELLTPYESLDVDCTIRGYRAVRLEGVRGELDVPLVSALRVRLVLPRGAVLPAPPRYLKATLVGRENSDIDWGASAFDENRESTSLVSGTGRMRVQWMLERRSPDGASATTIDVEPVQWVEVVESSQEQRIELVITQEALDRALAKAPL